MHGTWSTCNWLKTSNCSVCPINVFWPKHNTRRVVIGLVEHILVALRLDTLLHRLGTLQLISADVKHTPCCGRVLRSSRMLCSLGWQLVTVSSGQPILPRLRGSSSLLGNQLSSYTLAEWWFVIIIIIIIIIVVIITYSMEQSPSWEANWFCS